MYLDPNDTTLQYLPYFPGDVVDTLPTIVGSVGCDVDGGGDTLPTITIRLINGSLSILLSFIFLNMAKV